MPKRISEEIINLIERLYRDNVSYTEIAKTAGVSIGTVYSYTKIRERGFKSSSDYREYLARERGFKSLSEYQEHLARERGFKSLSEYQEHLARERGFKSSSDYREYLARERGFKSLSEYQEHLARERMNLPKNKKLSKLLKKKLKELGKNQSWLGEQIDVSRQMVSFYVAGKSIPNEVSLIKILTALKIDSHTLEDLLE